MATGADLSLLTDHCSTSNCICDLRCGRSRCKIRHTVVGMAIVSIHSRHYQWVEFGVANSVRQQSKRFFLGEAGALAKYVHCCVSISDRGDRKRGIRNQHFSNCCGSVTPKNHFSDNRRGCCRKLPEADVKCTTEPQQKAEKYKKCNYVILHMDSLASQTCTRHVSRSPASALNWQFVLAD